MAGPLASNFIEGRYEQCLVLISDWLSLDKGTMFYFTKALNLV